MGDGAQELSFHPQLMFTPSLPLEGEAKREEDSAERRRQILEDLQLPPLRHSNKGWLSRTTRCCFMCIPTSHGLHLLQEQEAY